MKTTVIVVRDSWVLRVEMQRLISELPLAKVDWAKARIVTVDHVYEFLTAAQVLNGQALGLEYQSWYWYGPQSVQYPAVKEFMMRQR